MKQTLGLSGDKKNVLIVIPYKEYLQEDQVGRQLADWLDHLHQYARERGYENIHYHTSVYEDLTKRDIKHADLVIGIGAGPLGSGPTYHWLQDSFGRLASKTHDKILSLFDVGYRDGRESSGQGDEGIINGWDRECDAALLQRVLSGGYAEPKQAEQSALSAAHRFGVIGAMKRGHSLRATFRGMKEAFIRSCAGTSRKKEK